MATQHSTTLAVSIDCPCDRAYHFIADPTNLPGWAGAFIQAVRRVGDGWVIDTADGSLGFRFVAQNELGVLDHFVTLPSGEEILNPMRVVPNATGCDVLFTLFQREGMSMQVFLEDEATVRGDLESLKRALES